jgi:hypothetical protein
MVSTWSMPSREEGVGDFGAGPLGESPRGQAINSALRSIGTAVIRMMVLSH